jgi:hypothetical protein
MRGWIIRALPLVFLWMASGAASPVQAAHLVTFTRGQSIVVQSFEKRGVWYYFILDGGGEMGVQVNQVVQIEDYEAPPPSAIAPAAAPAMPPPPSAPPQVSSGAPEPGPGAPGTAAPPSGAAPSADNAAANVMSRGNDWRFRARMSGGPSIQQGGGGLRKPPGMGGGVGVGRILTNNTNQNPNNRQVPPPQTGNPTQ